jgi:hypothetical protein
MALAQEAIELGSIVGDHTSVSAAIGTQGLIALRRGEWRLTLEASVESAVMAIEFGTPMLATMSLFAAVAAFAGLGRFEPAAVLLAACDALAGARFGPDWGMAMMVEVDAALLDHLGADRLSALQSRGAALGPAAAVDYLQGEAARALNEG